MSLQEFINKNKEELASELRCGSCGNSLQQCGKYEIVKVGLGQGKQRSEEGILCESCKAKDRKLVNVTRIYESPATAIKQVANFRIVDITKVPEKEVSKIEQYKKIKEAESVTNNNQTKVVVDEKTKVKQEKKEESKDKDKKKE